MEQSASRSSSRPPLRAGGTALSLLASSLNLEVLRGLAEGPQRLQDLMRRLGFPPRSTMSLYLHTLTEMGAVERRPRSAFPTSVDYEITEGGRALLGVSETLQTWLLASPAGSIELGGTAARSAIKALVEGWASNIIRALATRPLSLTELNSLIPRISYPSLERRLTAMRQVDLLEVQHTAGRTTPYEVSGWLRRAVAPVTAAIGWERRYAEDRTPDLRRLDVEAAFLLAIPLIELDHGLSGRCRLAVEVHDGATLIFAGVLVSIEEGKVVSCVPSLESDAGAWVSGSPLAWLRRINGTPRDELEVGGDSRLAEAAVDALARTSGGPQ
jgi:DNA-binding HxlR family transcriptional regulator